MVKQPNKSESHFIEDLILLKEAVEICAAYPTGFSSSNQTGWALGNQIGGRNLFTTKSAVEEYLARGRRPGPKPEK